MRGDVRVEERQSPRRGTRGVGYAFRLRLGGLAEDLKAFAKALCSGERRPLWTVCKRRLALPARRAGASIQRPVKMLERQTPSSCKGHRLLARRSKARSS